MDNVQKFKNKITREMKSGFIALLLLYVIEQSHEPIYGYRIIQNISTATKGNLKFREGTVYPILRYLLTQDFLISFLGESPNGAPRKYYQITKHGEIALAEGIQSWQRLRSELDDAFKNLEVK